MRRFVNLSGVTGRDDRPILLLRLEACREAVVRLRAQPPSVHRHELIGRFEREGVAISRALRVSASVESTKRDQ